MPCSRFFLRMAIKHCTVSRQLRSNGHPSSHVWHKTRRARAALRAAQYCAIHLSQTCAHIRASEHPRLCERTTCWVTCSIDSSRQCATGTLACAESRSTVTHVADMQAKRCVMHVAVVGRTMEICGRKTTADDCKSVHYTSSNGQYEERGRGVEGSAMPRSW